jgi:membrane fusion protein, copper/silver efflux system
MSILGGRKRSILIIGVVIFLGALSVWGVNHFGPGKTPREISMSHAKLYHCPMHPTYLSERPGDCPICSMRLVEIEKQETATPEQEASLMHEGSHGNEVSDAHEGSRAVEAKGKSTCLLHNCQMLIEGRVCPMLIFTGEGELADCPVCGTPLEGSEGVPVEEPGAITDYTAVTLSTERVQLIGMRTSPVVRAPATKTIRTVGQIAHDPKVYQAEEEYLQAVRALRAAEKGQLEDVLRQARSLVASARIKLELMGFTEELITEIEEANRPDESLLLARSGGKIWMYAPIYETDLDIVKVGHRVEVTAANVLPGKIFYGRVRAIDPVLDPVTRSIRIRAQLDNPQALLKPNVYVNALIRVDLGSQLLIPESAVLDSGERRIAFVERIKGVFEPRILRLGPKLENAFVVITGVSEGERVVDQATFFIDSESKLKAAIQSGSKSAGGGHQH